MKKVQCKEGLDVYKKFLTRMTRISEFLKVAEVSGAAVDGPTVTTGTLTSLSCCSKWASTEGTSQTCLRLVPIQMQQGTVELCIDVSLTPFACFADGTQLTLIDWMCTISVDTGQFAASVH